MKTRNKVKAWGFILFLIVIIVFQARAIMVQSSTIEFDRPEVEPVCTSLDCEIERRTVAKYEENYADNMESARLQVLLDINQEMQFLATDPEKRLNH